MARRELEFGPERLAADLDALGVAAGSTVLVHCSMSAVGRVAGGPEALLGALLSILGTEGTLVVPAQTAGNSNTSPRYLAATAGLSPDEAAAFETTIPGFDPATSPVEGMGSLAERVRRQPGAVRSGHPQTSFAALGPRAAALTAVHDLDCHLGERSPLGALYAADAKILLLGVGYAVCTAFHLAEYRLPKPPELRPHRCYVRQDTGRIQLDFLAPHLDDSDFSRLGLEVERTGFVRTGLIGAAPSRLLPMPPAVDLAVEWMIGHRQR